MLSYVIVAVAFVGVAVLCAALARGRASLVVVSLIVLGGLLLLFPARCAQGIDVIPVPRVPSSLPTTCSTAVGLEVDRMGSPGARTVGYGVTGLAIAVAAGAAVAISRRSRRPSTPEPNQAREDREL